MFFVADLWFVRASQVQPNVAKLFANQPELFADESLILAHLAFVSSRLAFSFSTLLCRFADSASFSLACFPPFAIDAIATIVFSIRAIAFTQSALSLFSVH